MMTAPTFPIACLFRGLAACLLLLAVEASAQAPAPAGGESPAASAARASYEKASAELASARDELEALVLDLEDDYVELTGPHAATLKNALVIAMHDSLPAVRARLLTREAQAGRRPTRGMRKEIMADVFAEPVSRATALDPRLTTFVARHVADELSGRSDLEDVSAETILQAVEDTFIPGESWFEFWNRSFHLDLDASRRWTSANEAVQTTWQQLDQVLHPERYGPRGQAVPPGMIVVPGGSYKLGPDSGLKRPARTVTLAAFALDQREVTNREYAAFVGAQPQDARAALLPRGWKLDGEGRPAYDEALRDHPVVYVSWTQASAFASWHGKRLPTEDEWEAAAAGFEGRAFPWGDEFRNDAANGAGGPGTTMPVESFPESPSAAHCFDMAGNVWEWTSTTDDGVDVKALPEGYVSMVIRGGGFDSRRDELACRYRWTALGQGTFGLPTYKTPIGFRCAKTLE
ncbi:MAG: SUMF1/EgtB/PvdO family nonheme iron enzyme [Planctomycetes bacterium]|nr:SUMF1/EgtB/PvdO family nonheme iron enzyme [Planctomycetota bacterium]